MAAGSKEILAARISYLIDDLLCDPSLAERQRSALLRVRSRFTAEMAASARTSVTKLRPAPRRKARR